MNNVCSERDNSNNGGGSILRKTFLVRLLLPLIIVLLFHPVLCECLVHPRQPQNPNSHINIIPASQEELYPTLILLGGIAQTKSSWDHHLASLARNRKVVVYECLGQGSCGTNDDNNFDSCDASLPAQAQRLLKTLEDILIDDDDDIDRPVPVDIAGFSFGGRVAMATACLQNDRNPGGVRIRRLHLTGVACDRSDFGHLAMRSFPDVIRSDPSLRSFAWSILLATYSSGYLRGLPETTLERFLDHISSTNSPEGLLAILDQAEVIDTTDPWHVVNMADRLADAESESNSNNIIIGKLCVGEFDKMAPVDEVDLLRKKLGCMIHQTSQEIDILSDCGHAVVLEKPRAWRESVLSFLNEIENNDDTDDRLN